MSRHIDVWILDTEGSEYSVLQGVDFEAIQISTLVVECDQHDKTKNSQKTELLEKNGFQCQQILRNCFCKHKNFTPSAAPADKLTEIRIDGGNKRPPF